MNKLYVGNIEFSVTNEQLADHFSKCGEVKKATVILNRDTGRSKGFGFVEMDNAESALSLHGSELNGRALTVKEALPPEHNNFMKEIREFCNGDCQINDSIDITIGSKKFNIARLE